jgi:hypothetical protein
MKKYIIIAVIAVLIMGLVWYFVSKKNDAKLFENPKPTPEVKAALKKALPKDYLATKGKVRTYEQAIDKVWEWGLADPNNDIFITKEKLGGKTWLEHVKGHIEWNANN